MQVGLSRISLLFLLIIMCLGTLLRAAPYIALPSDYAFFLHAHSHVAFQGWIYTVMVVLFTSLFLSEEHRRKYRVQFFVTLGVVVAILVSFSLQGYALFSIIFSSLFQFLNYWFIYSLWKDLRLTYGVHPPLSVRFLRMSLVFGLLSTIGPWLIAVLTVKGLNGTELYHSVIYYFLHFQYNGWFLFGVFALYFHYLERSGMDLHPRGRILLTLAILTVFFSYVLSLTGMSFGNYLLIPGVIAIVLQLTIPIALFSMTRNRPLSLMFKSKTTRFLVRVAFVVYTIKSVLQMGALLPAMGNFSYYNRFSLMFILHLSLIGVLTLFFIAILTEEKLFKANWARVSGISLLITGFVISEMLLLVGGAGLSVDNLFLLLSSAMMPLGTLLLVLSSLVKKQSLT